MNQLATRTALLLLTSVSILSLTGCGGSTDPRLVGKWTGNPTLTTKMDLDFRSDGTLGVKSVDASGKTKKSTGSWNVVSTASDHVIIELSTGPSDGYKQRKVKFISADHIGMTDNKGVKRGGYRRVGS